jgi:thermitase
VNAQRVPSVGKQTVVNFVEQPGYMEFTGEMLVRPLQREALQRLGLGPVAIEAQREAAAMKLADMTIGYSESIDLYTIKVPAGMTENRLARELMSTGLYEYAEPNWRVFPQAVPNDPNFGSQYSHGTGAGGSFSANAWDIFLGNPNIIVGITDTGVHVTHVDLQNRVLGANSVQSTAWNTGTRTEADFGTSIVKDLNGHGTHCTGIAAANTNNGLLVAGVAGWGGLSKHVMVRVSDSSGGSSTINALIYGAEWAVRGAGARVVSTSYSGYNSAAVQTMGANLKNNFNVLYCWAAGNTGAQTATTDHPDVTVVGATNAAGTRASFSAWGVGIDVMAPGDNILSTIWVSDSNNTSLGTLAGTSMASPFAAGIGAVVAGVNPNYSGARLEQILYRSCRTMGNPAENGWGRVSHWNAMGRVANTFSLFRGVLLGGNVNSLYRVDSDTLNVGKGIVTSATEPPVQIVTEHNVPSEFGSNIGEIAVQVTARVNTSGAMQQRVQLWNFSTGAYDDVAQTSIGTSFNFFEAVRTTGLSNYISGGIVRARTQIFANGPVAINNWQALVDQINVRVLRATE